MPATKPLLVNHALTYARRGLAVFPVNPRTKAPLTDNGMHDASSDPNTITQWWKQHPTALIGCRIPENRIILDIDPRHGGDQTWRLLENSYGPITIGRQHRSGRNDNGFHAWAKRPEGTLNIRKLTEWARRNGVGEQAGKNSWTSGIDLLHHGHRYTILPPSPHPATGLPYAWVTEGEPQDLPPFIIDLITAEPTPKPAPRPRLVNDADSIADWYSSTRSWADVLTDWVLVSGDGDSDGSKWRHPNASAESSASTRHGCLFVYTTNTDLPVTEQGDPHGLTRFRAWAILDHSGDLSAAAHTARELRDGPTQPTPTVWPIHRPGDPWPEPIPLGEARNKPIFPLDVLPAWIANQCQQIADDLQFDPDLPAQLALTVLSIIAGRTVRVHVTGPWTEAGCNTYLATAMDSSDGKSPAFSKMLQPIDTLQQTMTAASAQDREHAATERKIIERDRDKAITAGDRAKARHHTDELANVPEIAAPRLYADDVTPERLAVMLSEQGCRLAIVSSEGGVFRMMGKGYSDTAILNDVYLKSWSGDTLTVDRIGRPSVVVNNPRLTIGVTVQPSVLTGLSEYPELHDRGLIPRFMMALPDTRKGHRDKKRPTTWDDRTDHTYQTTMLALADLYLPLTTPITLRLDHGALDAFTDWQQDHEHRLRPRGDLETLAVWIAKMHSTVIRVAGLLHIAAGNTAPVIGTDTILRAMTIGEYWIAHAKIVGDLWGVDPVLNGARKILAWAVTEGHTDFTVRDVYSAMRRLFPRAEATVEPLQLLTERGWIRPMFEGPLVVGRPRVESPRFAVSSRATTESVLVRAVRAVCLKHDFQTSSSSFQTQGDGGGRAHCAHCAHYENNPDTETTTRSDINPVEEPW